MAQPCKICSHAERAEIEAALRGGTSLRATAQQFGVTKDALARHRLAHVAHVAASPSATDEAAETAEMGEPVEATATVAEPAFLGEAGGPGATATAPHYDLVLAYWSEQPRLFAWRASLAQCYPQLTAAELDAVLAQAVRVGDLAGGQEFFAVTPALLQRLRPVRSRARRGVAVGLKRYNQRRP